MKFSPELREKTKKYFKKQFGEELDDSRAELYLKRLAQLGMLFAENIDALERLSSNNMDEG